MVRSGNGHGEKTGAGALEDRHSEASSSGFLTKAQQEILDAAVREKQKSGKISKIEPD